MYKRLGSEVSVIEYSDKITPFMDSDISKELLKILKKKKINFYLSHEVFEVENKKNIISIKAKNKNDEIKTFECDYCLVSVGRKAYTEGLGLENVGIEIDSAGKIVTDSKFKTNAENIYAIGDVIKGPMLAHKAEEEGIAVAEILKGEKPHIDYNLVPNVIYTWPEVSSVGSTEKLTFVQKLAKRKASRLEEKKDSYSSSRGDLTRGSKFDDGSVNTSMMLKSKSVTKPSVVRDLSAPADAIPVPVLNAREEKAMVKIHNISTR